MGRKGKVTYRGKKTKPSAEMFNSNTGNDKIVESLQTWEEVSLNISVLNCVSNTTVFQEQWLGRGEAFHTETDFYEKKKKNLRIDLNGKDSRRKACDAGRNGQRNW